MQNLTFDDKKIAVQRLTAFWALSECGLGGFLHLFKIPFTGLLVGGLAIICIACIFLYSDNKKQVFQSLLIVLCIKLSISPFTPPTAYLSVCFQAFLGYIVYSLFGLYAITFFIVVILCMLQSALQKLIVLTLFFGTELWQAVDVFLNFVSQQLGFSNFSGSFILIATYLIIYVLGAIFVSLTFRNILQQITTQKQEIIFLKDTHELSTHTSKNKKKRFLKLFGVLAFIMIVLFFISNSEITIYKVTYLVARTILVIFVWFYVLTPLVGFILKKSTANFSISYKSKIAESLQFFPELKQLVKQVWNSIPSLNFAKRVYFFLVKLFVALITYKTKANT